MKNQNVYFDKSNWRLLSYENKAQADESAQDDKTRLLIVTLMKLTYNDKPCYILNFND
jgi:hypothetical protein